MAKPGTLTLTGKSGKKYDFDVYSNDTPWASDVACVYYVSKRIDKRSGGGSHTAIYIGETGDLKDRFSSHHKQSCFDKNNYNAISVHRESNESVRLQVESDLVGAIAPPCND